jgi:hypothetical protein
MTLKRGIIASALFAATAAASIAVAPAAFAAPTCTGNAQITATPPYVNYQSQYPFFGEGGLLLFHHGHDR